MATRMQQRRGTAAQWISTNSGNGPILNAGEIGWESDTNKFKMGDGTNTWLALDYFADINSTVNPAFGSSITFEGATANDYETVLAITDPTADRTITLPNVTGTVITTGNLSDITDIGVFTSTIVMEGSSADAHELTLSSGNPTADRTITFPDSTGTVALAEDVASSLGTVLETSDIGAVSGVVGLNGDKNALVPGTKIIFEGSDADNEFETELVIINPTEDVTLTFPNATDTMVGRLSTDTLTNKSISLANNTVTSTLAQLNTAVSDADVASLAGAETLTNKTISIASNTLTGVAPIDSPTFTGTVTIPSGASISGFAPLASPALTGTATAVNLTISGNLTVDGTTTNINSTNLVVEDKNVVLGDTATPTDTTADGGGLTLKGATDKTFNWVDATDAWTSSEHINLASGKAIYLNGTLETATAQTLTNKTIDGASNTLTVRIGNDVSGLGSGVATFLATPSSANFASVLTDEIGTGNVVLSELATNAQTASYTLVLEDKGKLVEMNVATANNLTVPLNSSVAWPVGSSIDILQMGAGQTTIVATAGVTINATPGLKIRTQYASATLLKRATDTWILLGDLSS